MEQVHVEMQFAFTHGAFLMGEAESDPVVFGLARMTLAH
jgi:hypothetical protein